MLSTLTTANWSRLGKTRSWSLAMPHGANITVVTPYGFLTGPLRLSRNSPCIAMYCSGQPFGVKPQQQESLRASKALKAVQMHEYNNPDSRLAAVAADYSARPEECHRRPNRTERDDLTQLARADLYAQSKLGREAHTIPVLVEKTTESKMRVESYAPGDRFSTRVAVPISNPFPTTARHGRFHEAQGQPAHGPDQHHPQRNHVQSLAAPRSDAREPDLPEEVRRLPRVSVSGSPVRTGGWCADGRSLHHDPHRPGPLYDRPARLREDRRAHAGEDPAHRLRLSRRWVAGYTRGIAGSQPAISSRKRLC